MNESIERMSSGLKTLLRQLRKPVVLVSIVSLCAIPIAASVVANVIYDVLISGGSNAWGKVAWGLGLSVFLITAIGFLPKMLKQVI